MCDNCKGVDFSEVVVDGEQPRMSTWVPHEASVATYNALSLRRFGARQTLAVRLSASKTLAAGIQEARPLTTMR